MLNAIFGKNFEKILLYSLKLLINYVWMMFIFVWSADENPGIHGKVCIRMERIQKYQSGDEEITQLIDDNC